MFVKILEGTSINSNPVTAFLNDHGHEYGSSIKRKTGRTLLCSPGVVKKTIQYNSFILIILYFEEE